MNPFGECEGDEHVGQLKWRPYPKGLDGKFTDGKQRGIVQCSVCLNTVDFGITKEQANA